MGSGLVSVARSDKYCFKDSKVAACSMPHAKSLAPCSVFRDGRLRSANHNKSVQLLIFLSIIRCLRSTMVEPCPL
jgi:hypothetical protein